MAMVVPAFHSQERHALRCLRAIAGALDFHAARCARLEQALARAEGSRRTLLLRDLLAARQAEQEAILALRDGVVYTSGLVPGHCTT